MKSYFVYILKCNDKSYYTGITNNLEKRIVEHNFGYDKNSYTYNRRPVEIVYSEYFTDATTAIQREKQIKGWSRAKKEALIAGNFDEIVRLSKRKTK